jgi:glucose-6-phosphate isomerase
MSALIKSPIWQDLTQHALTLKKQPLSELFINDPERCKKFSLSEQTLYLDYSKNPVTRQTLQLLAQLADSVALKKQIHGLFSGAFVNSTQQLPALHTALRDPRKTGLIVNGEDILPKIHAALDKMQHLVEQIHHKQWRGFSGKKITDIVNLGIGGSDLGPLMAVYALKAYHQSALHFHFISNLDNKALRNLLEKINFETTLFIITSKSFTTLETLLNARCILKLFQEKHPQQAAIKPHFLAVTCQAEKAIEFGIEADNIFPLWDWVGGRYSLWSSVGLPIALAVGMSPFRELLHGAHVMDQHFFKQTYLSNMPILLALLGIWQVNFFQSTTHAILPYDAALKYFPAYLQQLEMESNGKSMRIDNQPVDYATCPLILGELGLNAQHAFYQFFHQGTGHFSADFLLTLRNLDHQAHHHPHVIASALSQSKAFMEGYKGPCSHKNLAGNHANNLVVLDELTPFSLGMLIALYEHKVFVQGVIWQINPFDQWGVEYGKQLNKEIYQSLSSTYDKKTAKNLDSSTQELIKRYQTLNKNP